MNKKTIELEGMTVELNQGDSCSLLYDTDFNVSFQCLEGRCGRCIIKLVSGNLGQIKPSEEKFTKSLNLDIKSHRLLCQCTLEDDTIIEKI